jgi:hypothetical protein
MPFARNPEATPLGAGNLMLEFQGGRGTPVVTGGVKAPPTKRQGRAMPKAVVRRGFTWQNVSRLQGSGWQQRRNHVMLSAANLRACTGVTSVAFFNHTDN